MDLILGGWRFGVESPTLIHLTRPHYRVVDTKDTLDRARLYIIWERNGSWIPIKQDRNRGLRAGGRRVDGYIPKHVLRNPDNYYIGTDDTIVERFSSWKPASAPGAPALTKTGRKVRPAAEVIARHIGPRPSRHKDTVKRKPRLVKDIIDTHLAKNG